MQWIPETVGIVALLISVLAFVVGRRDREAAKVKVDTDAAKVAGVLEATIGASLRELDERITKLEQQFNASESAVVQAQLVHVKQDIERILERLEMNDRRFSRQKHLKIDPYILEVGKLRVKGDALWGRAFYGHPPEPPS